MTLVALTHGYVPAHSLGGEVSLHRTLVAAGRPAIVLTQTEKPYELDGIHVKPIATGDVLNVNADPAPIIRQLAGVNATAVLAQNELSLPAVKAARELGIPSIVSVHTPPKYGRNILRAVQDATHRIYNTNASSVEWARPGLVLHPPTPFLPTAPTHGDAYTILSNLSNKGAAVVLDLAERMPGQRFIIVRSPAEATHGLPDFDDRAAALPNVEVAPRVAPDEVADRYLAQTRILLVPSKYETYGMSAIEAAGYGIPSVHVDTPHVREGIGDAAELIRPLSLNDTIRAVDAIEADYTRRSDLARARAAYLALRQDVELDRWAAWLDTEVNDVRRDPHRSRAA
jgi:glycosyltransferase involved in cell wall biosynthesis